VVTLGPVAAGANIEATKIQQRNGAPWRQGDSDGDVGRGSAKIFRKA